MTTTRTAADTAALLTLHTVAQLTDKGWDWNEALSTVAKATGATVEQVTDLLTQAVLVAAQEQQ